MYVVQVMSLNIALYSSGKTSPGLVLRLSFSSPSSIVNPLLCVSWLIVNKVFIYSVLLESDSQVQSLPPAADSTGQLALNALLERCEEVLLKFVADERLSGSCPLPRSVIRDVEEGGGRGGKGGGGWGSWISTWRLGSITLRPF